MAERIKGHRRAGSGNQPMFPGDVVHERFLIECKTTDKESFSVSRRVIEKIRKEALSVNKDWLLMIEVDGLEFSVLDYDVLVSLIGG